jgi:bifunctional non-homologous end joining protein LigD
LVRRPRAAGGDRLRFIEFILPTLVERPPEGDDWIHEIKYDGYRTELLIQGGECQAFTRRGFDWSAKYPTIVKAAAALPVKSAIVDGEAIVLDEKGMTDIGALRSAMRWQPERLIYVAFDLIHLDGEDLRFRPLVERKAKLEQIVGAAGNDIIQYSQHVEGNGRAFYDQVDRMGLEGMVSKRASSPYRSGRAETWQKAKCYEESTYEVAGVLREPGRPAVAYMVTPDKERRYVGGAFITLNQQMRERLWARVQRAKGKPVKGVDAKPGTVWVKPGIIGRVRHLKGEEKLRHATLEELSDEQFNRR